MIEDGLLSIPIKDDNFVVLNSSPNYSQFSDNENEKQVMKDNTNKVHMLKNAINSTTNLMTQINNKHSNQSNFPMRDNDNILNQVKQSGNVTSSNRGHKQEDFDLFSTGKENGPKSVKYSTARTFSDNNRESFNFMNWLKSPDKSDNPNP